MTTMVTAKTTTCSTETPTDAECVVVENRIGGEIVDGVALQQQCNHDGGDDSHSDESSAEKHKKEIISSRSFLRLAIFAMLIGLLGLWAALVSIVHDRYNNNHIESGINHTMTYPPMTYESCKIMCDQDTVTLPVEYDPMLLMHYENLQRQLVSIGALSLVEGGDKYECSPENQALWQLALDLTDGCSFFNSGTLATPPLNHTSIKNRFVLYTVYASLGKLESHDDLHEDVCLHDGIICFVNEEIMFLDMSDQELYGSIPSQIAMLTSLRLLDLSTNFLTGTIWEDTFNNMKHLKQLRLTNNDFSGNLPSFLFRIPSLTRIEVSHNRFDGPLLTPSESWPASDMAKIDVSHNQFTGGVPDFNQCCGNLRYINVASNSFTGELSSDTLPIRTLAHLFLKNNPLLDLTHLKLHHMLELEELSLAGDNVPFPLPPHQTLPKLHHLDVASCHLTGTIPEQIWTPNLRFLNLSDNEFLGELDWDYVGATAQSLQVLDLSWNDLSGTVRLDDSYINVLHIQGNQLSLYDPIEFCAYSGHCHEFCHGDSCDD